MIHWYHGSPDVFTPGQVLMPRDMPGDDTSKYVWITPDADGAYHWGRRFGRGVHVYEVEPDLSTLWYYGADEMRFPEATTKSARVIREVEPEATSEPNPDEFERLLHEIYARPGHHAARTSAAKPGWKLAQPQQRQRRAGMTTLWRGFCGGVISAQHFANFVRPHAAQWARQTFFRPDRSAIGIHWTDDPDSAENFALDRNPDGWARESSPDDIGPWVVGLVLEAEVAESDIIDPDSDEGQDYADFSAIVEYGIEREVTVRRGAQVRITNADVVWANGETGESGSKHVALTMTVRAGWKFAKVAAQLGVDWERTRPWSLSREQFELDPPVGLRFDPSLRNEARNESEYGGTIKVGPKFFGLPNDQVRRAVLYHELGHDLADRMLADGSAWDLVNDDLWRAAGIRDLNGQTVPTEVLAEAYSILNDEPGWLRERFPSLVEPVTRVAREMGLPLTKLARTSAPKPGWKLAKVANIRGMNDDVPPEPGTAPIPPGTVRLYHYVDAHAHNYEEADRLLDKVGSEGILGRYAQGASYGEPGMVWASTELPRPEKFFVEFWARMNQLDIGRDSTPAQLEARRANVTMLGDVPPSQIVALHRPWHPRYRYIEGSPTVQENFRNDPSMFEGLGAEYDQAFSAWKKRHGKLRTTATQRPPLLRFEDEARNLSSGLPSGEIYAYTGEIEPQWRHPWIAALYWRTREDPYKGGTYLVIDNILVDERARRHGVASAMLDHLRELQPGIEVRHQNLSPDGKRWVRSLGALAPEDRYRQPASRVVGNPHARWCGIYYNRDADTLVFQEPDDPAAKYPFIKPPEISEGGFGRSPSNSAGAIGIIGLGGGGALECRDTDLYPWAGGGAYVPTSPNMMNPLYVETLERLLDTFPEFGRFTLHESPYSDSGYYGRGGSWSAWRFLESINDMRAQFVAKLASWNELRLYHGTCRYYADRILSTGLQPRDTSGAANHWSTGWESRPGLVYLSHPSRMTMSRSAMSKAQQGAMTEIFDRHPEVAEQLGASSRNLGLIQAQEFPEPYRHLLDPMLLQVSIPSDAWRNLRPDEDTTEYSNATTQMTGMPEWMGSIGSDGVVAYQGTIPPNWIRVFAEGPAAVAAGMVGHPMTTPSFAARTSAPKPGWKLARACSR